jgi:hypothetical protein
MLGFGKSASTNSGSAKSATSLAAQVFIAPDTRKKIAFELFITTITVGSAALTVNAPGSELLPFPASNDA